MHTAVGRQRMRQPQYSFSHAWIAWNQNDEACSWTSCGRMRPSPFGNGIHSDMQAGEGSDTVWHPEGLERARMLARSLNDWTC